MRLGDARRRSRSSAAAADACATGAVLGSGMGARSAMVRDGGVTAARPDIPAAQRAMGLGSADPQVVDRGLDEAVGRAVGRLDHDPDRLARPVGERREANDQAASSSLPAPSLLEHHGRGPVLGLDDHAQRVVVRGLLPWAR